MNKKRIRSMIIIINDLIAANLTIDILKKVIVDKKIKIRTKKGASAPFFLSYDFFFELRNLNVDP